MTRKKSHIRYLLSFALCSLSESIQLCLQDNDRIQVLNLEYLKEKIHQLEEQKLVLEKENSELTLAKQYSVSIIARLTLEKEDMEATKNQLDGDKQRLETELDWTVKQLAKVITYLNFV